MRMCVFETNRELNTLIVYANKGKEQTSSTSDKEDEESANV